MRPGFSIGRDLAITVNLDLLYCIVLCVQNIHVLMYFTIILPWSKSPRVKVNTSTREKEPPPPPESPP